MYLLLSGEGVGDLGRCNLGLDACVDGEHFQPGPLSWMIDRLVESFQGYEFSHLDYGRAGFVSESYLALNKPRPRQKIRLPGPDTPKETHYYYANARALAQAALRLSAEKQDNVIAVLFRDADGTATAGRGDWRAKRASIIRGFADEAYEYGVAMLPKPKSEAWLLCAVKTTPYQHCPQLEDESGNDDSPNSLKKQLAAALSGNDQAEAIADMIKNRGIDVERIDMPSFNVFKEDLRAAVCRALSKPVVD